jgi:UDPglucose 6-dehydrogenase
MDVANELGNVLNPAHDMTIVLKSTVPCTTTDLFSRVLKEQVKKNGHSIANSLIHVAHNPEFMREGCALDDMLMPYRIIIGTRDDVAVRMLEHLYSPILTQKFTMPNVLCFNRERRNPKLMITDPVTSELIKYASNAFLALKISYANEISILAKAYGADMKDISDGMGMDDRIAPYFLNAGLGWGGSCFPKDTKALVSMGLEQGCSMKITCAAIDVNEQQKARLVKILTNRL